MQKQTRRVPMAQTETTPWDAPTTATPQEDVRAAMSLQPLLRLATLAQRMAERYLAGKSGLAQENDAREARILWNELPDDIREML